MFHPPLDPTSGVATSPRRPIPPLLSDYPDAPASRVHACVRLPAGNVLLDGELDLPPGAKGLVIFAHGSGSSRHSVRNRFVAGMLRKAGIGTLLFDLLTPKEEVQDEVTHELRFAIPMLADRLVAVTRWALRHPLTHELPLGYFGASTGSAAALVAAAQMGDRIAAVVSRGGRPDLALSELARVKSPTLFIVGGADDIVLELNERAFASLGCDKQLRVITGATHLFEEPGKLEQVAQVSADWFRRRLVRQAIP